MQFPPPIILASQSPRRRRLLEAAGADVVVHVPHVEDALLRRGEVSPRQWAMALAYLKARSVLHALANGSRVHPSRRAIDSSQRGTIIAADTFCEHNGRLLGKPQDAAEARAMLYAMRNTTHRTVTGVCLLCLTEPMRLLFADHAEVVVGDLSDDAIEAYIAGGTWKGKAGAYNLVERIDAGWPIECRGDPTTVMGLPMRRLAPLLGLPELAA